MGSREEERASLLTRDERARERATGAVRSPRSIDDDDDDDDARRPPRGDDEGREDVESAVGRRSDRCGVRSWSARRVASALACAVVVAVMGAATTRSASGGTRADARLGGEVEDADLGRTRGRRARVKPVYWWNPQGKTDLLAVAAGMDPVAHAYLPDTFHGYDAALGANEYAHPPVVSGSKTGFTMCIDMPAQNWDSVYAKGFGMLFRPGLCVERIKIGCDDALDSDVRVFSQSGYLWRGKRKAKDGEYLKPEKTHPGQVDIYFAHEAAGTFGGDLRSRKVVGKFDYVAYFDKSKSAIWWPFGPTLNTMTESFPAYTMPHSERIPGVAWIAIDCLPPRPGMLAHIAERFPVFSMGVCMHNYKAPRGLPGRGVENIVYQTKMARYMFYFAMENAAACEGYMTEKVWMALSRGSIPIYMGASSIGDMMPTKNSYIDIRDYDSIDALVEELRAIARDEQKYASYTNWRYQHPREWSEGFRKLLRVMSTDIKAGVCSVLQKGDVVYPKAAPIKGTCDHDRILGRNPLAWTIDDIDRRRPRDPTDFLEVIPCSEKHDPTDECFKWRETPIGENAIVSPEEKRRRGAERRAEAAKAKAAAKAKEESEAAVKAKEEPESEAAVKTKEEPEAKTKEERLAAPAPVVEEPKPAEEQAAKPADSAAADDDDNTALERQRARRARRAAAAAAAAAETQSPPRRAETADASS